MIDFYYAPTPNGWEVAIMLEECRLDSRTILTDMTRRDQFKGDFLATNPNAKNTGHRRIMTPGRKLISVLESGAILRYLSVKTNRFGDDPQKPDQELHELFFCSSERRSSIASLPKLPIQKMPKMRLLCSIRQPVIWPYKDSCARRAVLLRRRVWAKTGSNGGVAAP